MKILIQTVSNQQVIIEVSDSPENSVAQIDFMIEHNKRHSLVYQVGETALTSETAVTSIICDGLELSGVTFAPGFVGSVSVIQD